MSDFKKLHVWQKAHALSLSIHRVSTRMRGSQYASLRSQIFRAAMSIPANIAEGRRQKSENEFGRFSRVCSQLQLGA
jgi:four helix bundle protein